MSAFSFQKGWAASEDFGLSLGRCCPVALGETSDKTVNHEAGAISNLSDTQIKLTAQVHSILAVTPCKDINIFPSPGWSGTENICCHISVGIEEEDGNTNETGKQRSSQYKGVLAQPNGRWGAQIYEKHRRVWLGTFTTEEDAEQSYDTAAMKIRGRKTITNFGQFDDANPYELVFLGQHSKSEIIEMLRTHSYRDELHDYYKGCLNVMKPEDQQRHLFEKILTSSDVGRLNRLVIHRLHARMWLPLEVVSMANDVILHCEDNVDKTWRFKYSYWSSSKSYVLTKGWCRYTKCKLLKAGDIVSFECSTNCLRQLDISFRHRAQQPSIVNLPVQRPLLVNHLPSDSGAEMGARVQDGSVNDLIPFTSLSSAYDFYGFQYSSEKRNSRPLEFGDLRNKDVCSFASPDCSSVTVFGVDLNL